jgi:hypothetical protein
MEKVKEVNAIIEGDTVISSSRFSMNKIGEVVRISDKAIHVRFGEYYQKFHFRPTRHTQSPISEINHLL